MRSVEKELKTFQDAMCLCTSCPSRPSAKGLVFCRRGTAAKQKTASAEPKGCLCENCALAEMQLLEENYYCKA